MIRVVVLLLVAYCSADTCTQRGEITNGRFNVVSSCNGTQYNAIGCKIGETDECFDILDLNLAFSYSRQLSAYSENVSADQSVACGEQKGPSCICETINLLERHPSSKDLAYYALEKVVPKIECDKIQSTRYLKHGYAFINSAVEQAKCERNLPPMKVDSQTNVCAVTGSTCIDLAKLKHVSQCNSLLESSAIRDCSDDACICDRLTAAYRIHGGLPDNTALLTLNNITHAKTCPALDARSVKDMWSYNHVKGLFKAMVGHEGCVADFKPSTVIDANKVHYFTSTKTNGKNQTATKVRCVTAVNLEKNLNCNSQLNELVSKSCKDETVEKIAACKLEEIQHFYDQHHDFMSYSFEQMLGLGECPVRSVAAPSADHASGHETALKDNLDCINNLTESDAADTCIIDLASEKLMFSDINGHLSCNSHLKNKMNCGPSGCSCADIAKVYAKHAGIENFRRVMNGTLRATVVSTNDSDKFIKHMILTHNIFMNLAEVGKCNVDEPAAIDFTCAIQVDKPASSVGLRSRVNSGKCWNTKNLASISKCYETLKPFFPQDGESFYADKIKACDTIQDFYDVHHASTALYLLEEMLDITECEEVKQANRVLKSIHSGKFKHIFDMVADLKQTQDVIAASN